MDESKKLSAENETENEMEKEQEKAVNEGVEQPETQDTQLETVEQDADEGKGADADATPGEEEDDPIPEIPQHKFFVFLKGLPDQTAKRAMAIAGFLVGCLTMGTLWLTSGTQDQILQWAFIAVLVVAMLVARKIQKEVGWNMNAYRIFMIVGMGLVLVAMLIEGLVSGKFFA